MIVIGDISELLNGLSAAAYVFYTLTFTSLLIMRVTHKREPRPFKVNTFIPFSCTFLFQTHTFTHPVRPGS